MDATDLTYIVMNKGERIGWVAQPVEHKFHDFVGIGDTPADALRESIAAAGRGQINEEDLSRDVVVLVRRDSYEGVSPEVERFFKED